MFEIQTPFTIKGIPLKPELSGRQKVDEVLTQTLAALMGYDGEARRLLTCALNGSLHTISPPVSTITNVVSTGATEDVGFDDTPCSEVMIMSNPANTGNVWVNVLLAAAIDTGWVLGPGEMVKFSINNLRDLHLHIITSGDKVIIIQAG